MSRKYAHHVDHVADALPFAYRYGRDPDGPNCGKGLDEKVELQQCGVPEIMLQPANHMRATTCVEAERTHISCELCKLLAIIPEQ